MDSILAKDEDALKYRYVGLGSRLAVGRQDVLYEVVLK